MIRLIPPAGTPIKLSELISILFSRLFKTIKEEDVNHTLTGYFNNAHYFFLNSGRAAMTMALKALQKKARANKIEIIIPAYTCYSVASSIIRAGCKIRSVDIDPQTLDYDYAQMEMQDMTDVLAIIGCNLFGVLNNWDKLQTLARDNNLYLIDDAAQSMGERYGGKPSGTLGDIGLYSLGRGKNLTTYSGGVLTTNDTDLADIINDEMNRLLSDSIFTEFKIFIKMLLYIVFIRPSLYWIPSSLPFLGIGETVFETDFSMSRLSRFQLQALNRLIHNLDQYRQDRQRISSLLMDGINQLDHISVPGSDSEYLPAFIRLPLIVKNSELRDKLIKRLCDEGITSTVYYPSKINDIPGIENYLVENKSDCLGADYIVEHLLTLPTNFGVKDKDIETVITILRQVE